MTRANDELAAAFRTLMSSFTHEWGFVVVRTAYATEGAKDEEQWSTALAKLRARALPRDEDAEMDPDTFALPVISDRDALAGASYDSVRTAFNAWVKDYTQHRKQEAVGEAEWESDVRRDSVLVVDEAALASLLQADDEPRRDGDEEPFVIVLDATDPASIPYQGGGPYTGWMRTHARSLNSLTEDLETRGMHEGIFPVRAYDSMIENPFHLV